MSRSGYRDDYEPDDRAEWLRSCAYVANTKRHMEGRLGQAFLWELYLTLTELPSRELVPDTMTDTHGGVCALGAVAARRGTPFAPEDVPEDPDGYGDWEFAEGIAGTLAIKSMMAREVMEANDSERIAERDLPGPPRHSWDSSPVRYETDQERWARMRRWCVKRLKGIP